MLISRIFLSGLRSVVQLILKFIYLRGKVFGACFACGYFVELPGLVVACVGSFEWLLWILTFCSKWQVQWCRMISCRRVCLLFRPHCWLFIVETHAVGCGLCKF